MDFNKKLPNILVIDDFYKDPDGIVDYAYKQEFIYNNDHYKGLRSKDRHLFPYVKEEFERLLNVEIIDWLNQPYNGCFQITNHENPLVYHSDSQQYAAAIYLTKDVDEMGTSFWKDKKYGHRRPPLNMNELNEVYSEYNIINGDNWELVDKVGGVYNRLVIWDAKMIHSASLYTTTDRLVQLFFFTCK